MIKIKVNNQTMTVPEGTSVATLLNQMTCEAGSFAVALNEERVIPRSEYATTQLIAGDRIEILAPMQGG